MSPPLPSGLCSERLVEYLLPLEVSPAVEPYKQSLLGPLMMNAVSRCLRSGDQERARSFLQSPYYPSHAPADSRPAMLELALPAAAQNILCLGTHAGDIEIGCSGTLLKWLAVRPELRVHWVVFTAAGKRAKEARASAKALLPKGTHKVLGKQFQESYLPYQGAKVKTFFETLKASFQPDIVFTHYREDRHQDHRLLSDLAWNTFRDHLILEYEIPKYDGDLGAPNFFVTFDEELARRKAAHLCRHFQTQGNKHWFAEETFLALMRLRGVECASAYAEAFHCRKLCVS